MSLFVCSLLYETSLSVFSVFFLRVFEQILNLYNLILYIFVTSLVPVWDFSSVSRSDMNQSPPCESIWWTLSHMGGL